MHTQLLILKVGDIHSLKHDKLKMMTRSLSIKLIKIIIYSIIYIEIYWYIYIYLSCNLQPSVLHSTATLTSNPMTMTNTRAATLKLPPYPSPPSSLFPFSTLTPYLSPQHTHNHLLFIMTCLVMKNIYFFHKIFSFYL